jgi:hypothetical protein
VVGMPQGGISRWWGGVVVGLVGLGVVGVSSLAQRLVNCNI